MRIMHMRVMKPRTIHITEVLVNTCDLGKEGPHMDPTQSPQRNGFPKKLAGAKCEKFFIGGIVPDRLLKEMFRLTRLKQFVS